MVRRTILAAAVLGILAFAACVPRSPTPDPVATRVAIALAVNATLTAVAPPPPTSTPDPRAGLSQYVAASDPIMGRFVSGLQAMSKEETRAEKAGWTVDAVCAIKVPHFEGDLAALENIPAPSEAMQLHLTRVALVKAVLEHVAALEGYCRTPTMVTLQKYSDSFTQMTDVANKMMDIEKQLGLRSR